MLGDPTASTVILTSDPAMTVRYFNWTAATQVSKPGSQAVTRIVSIVLVCMAASGAFAAAPKKSKTKTTAAKSSGAVKLAIKELDLQKEQLIVTLANVSRPPAPNLYRLTDERDRHYIAIDSACEEPDSAGARICRLTLPAGYGRHRLKTVELHIGGLHGRLVSVDPKEVAAAWDDAITRATMGIPAPPEPDKPDAVAGEGLLIPVGEF